jgi:hypothetical protein
VQVSAQNAGNAFEVCSRPGQCSKVLKYSRQVKIGFDCPPFAKQCTFFNTTVPAATSSRVATAKAVNELEVFHYPKIVGSQVRSGSRGAAAAGLSRGAGPVPSLALALPASSSSSSNAVRCPATSHKSLQGERPAMQLHRIAHSGSVQRAVPLGVQ